MPELVLSDITVMGQGYCVIGIERVAQGCFRSVRPMPPAGFAWREPFSFKRGDCVRCELRPRTDMHRPHVEDTQSSGLKSAGRSLDEAELVKSLKLAEVSNDIEGLFGCAVKHSKSGGNSWVPAQDGERSICGCKYVNLRFRIWDEGHQWTLRAMMALLSGERLASLPVVDRGWRRFLAHLKHQSQNSGNIVEVERVLNRLARENLLRSPVAFARLGLARGIDGKCWVMLDSLFPHPVHEWLTKL